jgi:hypothetical protein
VNGLKYATAQPPFNTSMPPVLESVAGSNANANANQWFPRYRFNGSTALSTSPMTGPNGSADQAGLSPFLLEHVSQFIVEYAGDFLTQNSVTGNVADTVPDGQIDWLYATKGDYSQYHSYSTGDFVMVHGSAVFYQAVQNVPATGTSGATNSPPNPTYWRVGTPPKQIRWYGMPRDSSGSGFVYTSRLYLAPFMTANELNNVVPLVDVWRTSTNNANRPVPYEVETGQTLMTPTQVTAGYTTVTDYSYDANAGQSGDPNINVANTGMSYLARYTAAFQNTTPAMVRIILKVDDPNNSIQDGPWFEYVFKLK